MPGGRKTKEVPKTSNGSIISRERRWIANDGGEVGSPTDAQGEILRNLAGEL
jgi:hypothetical protein